MLRWFVTAALLVPMSASAATLNVCSSCTHTTISSALTAATAGDTLQLSAESYGGTIASSKGVIIQGPTSGTATITSNMALSGGTWTIAGVTIDPASGRCVTVTGASTVVTLSDIVCQNGSATAGGGVYAVDGSDLTVTDSTFTNNASTGNGGGVYFAGGGDLKVQGSHFDGNSGVYGGGVYVHASAKVEILENEFCENSAVKGGGTYQGAAPSGSTNTWYNNVYTGNTATTNGSDRGYGGGAYFTSPGSPKIYNNAFLANASSGSNEDGPAVYMTSVSTLYFSNNVIAYNTAGSSDFAVVVSGSYTAGNADYNIWYNTTIKENSPDTIGPEGGSDPANSKLTNPLLEAFTDDANCANDKPWPATCSTSNPLFDAGNTGLGMGTDPDGSRIDIGPYGGSLVSGSGPWTDTDGDGDYLLCDCAPSDATTYTRDYYDDGDSDGYGDASTAVEGCGLSGVTVAGDCDDAKASVNPGATETCDGEDDDCDGTIDEDDASDATTWYLDSDGDNYGVATTTKKACNEPTGYAAVSTDCDDTRNTVYPGATETCNGRDDNCNGTTDEDTASDAATWYLDADGDGYGLTATTKKACSKPTGYASASGDCNDASAAVNPGATEMCNGIDDNCTGGTDEDTASDAATWYRDADGDTYGTPSTTDVACNQPTGYVSNSSDCDDTKSAVKPGATETCNGIDDDCDSTIDEGVKTTYYEDSDKDGYGNPAKTQEACSKPANYVTDNTDCDDTKASVKPGATETCNSIDDDCDTEIDEGLASDWYRDADGDTYGDASDSKSACSTPTGYVPDDTDCNDAAISIHPGATETCGDGVDSNCDGSGGPTDDEDKDGLSYTAEASVGASDCDTDSDNDTILDGSEWGSGTTAVDTDGDGTPNIKDTDDDGDGILTSTEGNKDTDGDLKPDYLDTDDDGDGYLTKDEKGSGTTPTDTDADGTPDYVDTDDDGDTIATLDEPTGDTDLDGDPDYLDDDDDDDGVLTEDEWAWGLDPYSVDSDSDSIDDSTEWGTGSQPRDTDEDSIPDPLDDDDDGDGIATLEEGDGDSDGAPVDGDPKNGCTEASDGIPNYLDPDSDGDGTADADEGTGDLDDDGAPNFADCNDYDGCVGDADFDGLSNCDERDILKTLPGDADTDNDGIPDGEEVGGSVSSPRETDGDGIIDALDLDDDGDSVLSVNEVGADPENPQDTDGDTTPDYLDTDDDDDGIPTIEEDVDDNGDPRNDDTDGDDIPNYLDDDETDGPLGDADGDGISNEREDELGMEKGSIDSDNDGVPDDLEIGDPDAPTDSDGDGTIDALDSDDDDDGIPTAEEGPFDADGDGVGNHLDDDSDGDGLDDAAEGTEDPDCDGAPAFLDEDETDGPCLQGGDDTDPPDTSTDPKGPCGCAVSPGLGSGVWAAMLALVTIRRRRSR